MSSRDDADMHVMGFRSHDEVARYDNERNGMTTTPNKPSTLGEQVAKAQKEYDSWSPEIRASVRLQGGDKPEPASTQDLISRLRASIVGKESFEEATVFVANIAAAIQLLYAAAPDRDAVLEEAALVCDVQARDPECPERAAYCADAIRALKQAPQPIAMSVVMVDDAPNYQNLFQDAVTDLADIHEALGLDPDDAEGAGPILEAIEDLQQKATSQQPVPALSVDSISMNEPLTDEQVDNLSAILDAYESGIGHGLQDDGHKNGPYSLRTCSIAYGVGYDEGLERAAIAAQLVQQRATLSDEEMWSHALKHCADVGGDYIEFSKSGFAESVRAILAAGSAA